MSNLEPVEATFALDKYWNDLDADVELVELRYVCAAQDAPPEWNLEHSRVMVPVGGQGGLATRRCVIDLPCGIAGASTLVWHYYFLIIQHGRQRTTAPTSEPIVSRDIGYPDDGNRYKAIAVQWGIDDNRLLNYTRLVAGELPPPQAIVAAAFAPGTSAAQALGRPALHRAFRGRVWGLRGSVVRCVFHLTCPGDGAAPAGSRRDAGWVELL